MKKDFPAVHLQETATEAGAGITRDLYSSAPEYHLVTLDERLKTQLHACKATLSPLLLLSSVAPAAQGGTPVDGPESSPRYGRTSAATGSLLQGPRWL